MNNNERKTNMEYEYVKDEPITVGFSYKADYGGRAALQTKSDVADIRGCVNMLMRMVIVMRNHNPEELGFKPGDASSPLPLNAMMNKRTHELLVCSINQDSGDDNTYTGDKILGMFTLLDGRVEDNEIRLIHP